MTRLTVIINSHNRPAYVQEAIDSVLNQSLRSLALIVVDQNSGWGDRWELCPYPMKEADPRMEVLYLSQNIGNVAGSNLGASAARGDYVSFLDDDNRYRPTFAQTMIGFLDDHPDLGAACCQSEVIRADGFRTGQIYQDPKLDLLERVNTVDHNSLVVRREVWEKLGGFDERAYYCHDWEFALRLRKHRIGIVPSMLVEYRIHEHRLSALTDHPGCRLCLEESVRYIEEKHRLKEKSDARRR